MGEHCRLITEEQLEEYDSMCESYGELENEINELRNTIKFFKNKLSISIDSLKDIMKDYEINGPCGEDCVGYYMYHKAKKTIEKLEEIK